MASSGQLPGRQRLYKLGLKSYLSHWTWNNWFRYCWNSCKWTGTSSSLAFSAAHLLNEHMDKRMSLCWVFSVMLVWYSSRLSFADKCFGVFLCLYVMCSLRTKLPKLPLSSWVKFCDVLQCFHLKLLWAFQDLVFFSTRYLLLLSAGCFILHLSQKIMQFLSTRFQYFTCQSKTIVLQMYYHLKFRCSLNPWVFCAIFALNYAVQKIFQHVYAVHKSFSIYWKGNICIFFFQGRGDGYLWSL